MLDKIFTVGLDLLAVVTPISIAATNLIFFPLAALWLFGAGWTWPRWPPVWGWPEKVFLVYVGVSFLSAFMGLDVRHSLREIMNKDFYILIAIVLVALVRTRAQNARLLKLFMAAGLVSAVWGLVQYAIGVNIVDKSDPYFFHLPAVLAHWPRRALNLLAMINGRVIGTRGHPLAYAECLLFNWAFAICFLLSARGRQCIPWILYIVLTGAALLVSQSRGPWIAAGIILGVAILTSSSRRAWPLVGIGLVFLLVFAAVPTLRVRAASILDLSHHSNKERMHMWRAGWQLWTSHPLLGIGPGNVKEVSVQYQNADERVWGPWGHLHSIYVNFLAERGALGLLSFLLFIGALCRELVQAMRKSAGDAWASDVYQAALLGVMGFLIGGLTEASYNTAVVIMTFYFVIGLALALARHEKVSLV